MPRPCLPTPGQPCGFRDSSAPLRRAALSERPRSSQAFWPWLEHYNRVKPPGSRAPSLDILQDRDEYSSRGGSRL